MNLVKSNINDEKCLKKKLTPSTCIYTLKGVNMAFISWSIAVSHSNTEVYCKSFGFVARRSKFHFLCDYYAPLQLHSHRIPLLKLLETASPQKGRQKWPIPPLGGENALMTGMITTSIILHRAIFYRPLFRERDVENVLLLSGYRGSRGGCGKTSFQNLPGDAIPRCWHKLDANWFTASTSGHTAVWRDSASRRGVSVTSLCHHCDFLNCFHSKLVRLGYLVDTWSPFFFPYSKMIRITNTSCPHYVMKDTTSDIHKSDLTIWF